MLWIFWTLDPMFLIILFNFFVTHLWNQCSSSDDDDDDNSDDEYGGGIRKTCTCRIMWFEPVAGIIIWDNFGMRMTELVQELPPANTILYSTHVELKNGFLLSINLQVAHFQRFLSAAPSTIKRLSRLHLPFF